MKTLNLPQCLRVTASLGLAFAIFSAATARANVYATDIKINGNLTGAVQPSGAVTISYILNEPATAGVTVKILQGSTVVASFSGTTNRGSNSASWTPTISGTYSVSITAAATGFPVWTQTSLDSSNNVAVSADGIAVDNTNSPYYGRVMLGCDAAGTAHGISQLCGIYKMNADGSPADEGSFGYGGYTTNDLGNTASGQMASGGGLNPWRLRIGEDDRLYMEDWSDFGAVIAFNMSMTSNQIVINEANYSSNPYFNSFNAGLGNFDVLFTTTTNATIWMCSDDPVNFGLWYWHMTNGAAVPTNTVGTWAVQSGASSDLSDPVGASPGSGGCMIDTNLDIFISQYHESPNPAYASMLYTNWDKGSLWPANPLTAEYGQHTNQVRWGVGTNATTFESVQDTVINNRQNPTMVALPMIAGNNDKPGIRLLNAANGTVVSVTNGPTVQTLTNLDYPNQYACAAWDNVGNLYGASTSLSYWRVWSPPGANQATTLAQATIQANVIDITSITVNGPSVVINFTAAPSEPASAFTLLASPTTYGTYTNANAVITGSSGSYQATATVNGTDEFYKVELP